MTYWKTARFKAMQEAWYAKLEESGFKDAEEMRDGEMMLKQTGDHMLAWHTTRMEYTGNLLKFESKETYYRILGEKVQDSAFQNDVDRIIVTMLAEGHRVKEITEELASQGESRCRMTIRMTLRKYEMKWGLRSYSPKQLNKKARSESA